MKTDWEGIIQYLKEEKKSLEFQKEINLRQVKYFENLSNEAKERYERNIENIDTINDIIDGNF